MPKKCPHCEEEIGHLNYNEDGTIHGNYDIETEDYEQEETVADGGTRFYCPECQERIDSVDDLIDIEDRIDVTPDLRFDQAIPTPPIRPTNDNEEEGRNLPVPPAIDSRWRGEYSGYHNSHDTQKNSAILTCPYCNCKNEAIESENVECYNCGKKINRSNEKKIVEIKKPNRGL